MQFLNVAARHNGGSAKSAFNQDYYPIDRAIDGVTTGHEGWAYHGRLDKAVGMFEFKQEYRVSRFRLLSGVGRFTDHHVTAFQVLCTNATGYMMPPAAHCFSFMCVNARARVYTHTHTHTVCVCARARACIHTHTYVCVYIGVVYQRHRVHDAASRTLVSTLPLAPYH